ncbi:MAG: HYR domain-containing protein [Chitinophagaceae bacterium]|nr:HYR domain-containing protein [Chitinophagaceae bacterium]
MRKFRHLLFSLLFISAFSASSKSQTTLVTGDIAFTGYISAGATSATDQFSFVLLVNVTANTVIKFTDYGWRTDIGAFTNRNGNLESELTYTTNAAYNAGTEITITSNTLPAAATATLVGGGSAGTVVTSVGASFLASSNFSLSTAGDQLFAYQGTFATPTFITGMHMNVYTVAGGDPVTADTGPANWDGVITTPATNENASSSGKPAAFTTGTNALWIGTTGVTASEEDNGLYNCASGAPITTAAQVRAACNNAANWLTNDLTPPGFVLPTGCNYIGILSGPPGFTTHPTNITVCEAGNTSFTIVATSAVSYQWQVDNGGGFANITNNATYSGATATTLNLTNVPASFNGYLYRCVATNGSGSTNSNNATLTVTALPINPTLLAKTPATASVADGTPVSATFNAGTGGSGGCVDDYRYTTDGGATFLPYTPGSNISTTGIAAGSGAVTIEGRRAGCATCSNNYVALATWIVTPLPAGATTLNAGDIAFSGYNADAATDEFSFVLLRNIGPGTVINFTDNGYQAGALTNVEQTITWTSNAAYAAGTEIYINGTTATLAIGGSAGTVTGTALSLITGGDQILAYRGTAVSPTFISGIHMNVLTTLIGDPVTTTAAAWDGTATGTSASALPPGLITGTNAIWIGTQDVSSSEVDNAKYGNCSGPAVLGPIATLRSSLNNQANWVKDDISPVVLPTGCPYLGSGAPPAITAHPSNSTICEGANTSFSITATGALSYQWQVDNGGGFANVTNNATYSGATTTTLNITAAPLSLNGYLYRCIATNPNGSANSNSATLTVNALPVSPTLLAKTPAGITVADGTPVSATFNAGSGGTGCSDDYRYTTDGGLTYLPYTPGSNISTTGIAAGSGFVFIEGRRANCSAGCQGSYIVLAMWRVTPLPAAPTTLAAGDIAFSAYASTSTPDAFSFVLLKNIGPGTVINFTDNGFQAGALTNVEQTVTWTSPAGGLAGGTEITISGTTATKSGGGAAGTVTGTALSLITSGDQILAYQGTAGAPIFISAIHMNVYSTLIGDPVTTTPAAWDGAATGTSASALPTGLTTGTNCIWIGTQDVSGSEHDNAKYGNCTSPALNGSLVALRASLNNQANWITDDNTPPSFTQPTGCNYLSVLCPTITVTNPSNATGPVNVAFSETFTSTGGAPVVTYSTSSTLPTGLTLSSAGVLSGTPTQAGTFPIVVVATDGAGCTGTGATYNLIITCPAPVLGTATPASQTICSGATITTIVLAGVPGAVYNWTRDNNVAVTGIAASGSGDISGVLTNTTAAPVTVTFTITPVTFGSCNNTVYTATVLVNPAPDAVATPSSQSICSGATITTIALTGAVSGTSFDWTRDNTGTVTGIAASGSGDISGALTNTTNAPVTVTFTITPTANSCPGAAITATVVVNPIPDAVATPSSQSRCSGQAITPILMSGAVSGTSYNWVRDNVPTIGGSIPASGTGNISGTLVNNTGSPVTVTFTITPTANGCPGTPITATVTVNPLPTASITGGNAYVCQGSDPVLTAGFDPGYTYQWGRSLFTTPFTNLGTAQTQVITASGNYVLTVTNQYGCVDTAMTVMNVADYRFNGTIGAGDAVQVGRLNRFAVISTCAAPKACPGIFTTTGNRFYDAYTITNVRNVPVCATIGINSFCATNIFCAAYLGSYNPTSQCVNYLADPGSSFTQSGFYEATIPANGTIVVVVHEVNVGAGCGGYTLTVDVPRDPSSIIAAPAATVCTGTPVTLTAPVANSYTWTPGGATTQAINVSPPVGTNLYSVNLAYGNVGCNADSSINVVVNPTPDVNAVADQYFCANSTAGPFTLTGSVPGTTYNWTNTNTAIGLGASGSGDIPSFTATNATAAPISGTITVTPVNGSCTGTPITFTITVSPIPSITSVTHDDVCAPGGVVNLAATGPGIINWYDALTAGNLVNSGTTYSPNISTTTTYYVESVVPSGPVSLLPMPAQSNTFPGNVRGYWFTAPTDFVITSLSVPTTASSGPQSIAIVKFTGNVPPPVFSATTNAFTTVFLTRNNPAAGSIACNIPVLAGEVIGILGYRGNINSYAPGDHNTTIAGFPVQLQRLGMQFPLTTTNPQNLWREFGPTTSISRVAFEYSPGPACSSTPRVPVTGTVNPIPVATATPSSQTVCSGPITTIVLTSNEPGTTYSWTRDNTVNVTGIATSGTGDISGTLTNNTTVPQTVTFTITPTITATGCAGAPITATVNVQAVPTITCPAPITVNNDVNQCGAVVTYSPTITGIPVPTVTYTFTGATTASGSGDGSGSFFNIGTTTVSITATNACGTANCSFDVTVNDTQNPTITCPAPVTVQCEGDVPPPNPASATAADNCPGVVVTFRGDVISGQTCANRYTITRTYRATDASGNFVECTQIITVNDVTAPVLTCPAPVTVSCAADVPVPNVGLVTGVSDNCGSLGGPVVVTWQGDVISSQTCANRYTITRTYRATDVCGNFAECTQIITVNDITPPTLTCPGPVTVSCAADVPPVNTGSVTGVSDNCAGAITVTHQGDVISNQTCANRYTITRTYRATDVCGNFTECTQIITVNDQTPPVLTCPGPVTVSCAAAVPAPNIASVTGVSDNCAGVVTVTHVSDVISNQTCANRYTITRTYRATDVCGNFTECTQIITVNDQTPPVLTCPGPVTVSCAAAVPAPNIASVTGVSDNCAGVVTVTHVSDVISNQTCANRYTITRTYRATDVCGNFSQCTQIITVNDITPPVITCPAAVTVSCASAVPAVNTASVTATDNCGGVITITHISDVISNQTCPNRFTLTRTYRATDVCGNFSQCTQIITVNDQTAPIITCPASFSVTTPFGSCTAVVNFNVTATDNCGAVTVVSVPASGSVFPIGNTLVTSTATDACGMTSTCSFTVTVIDAQLPQINTQPANTAVCVGTNASFTVVAITTPVPGGPLAYQWQTFNGSAWVDIAGATSATYTIINVPHSLNATSYRVRITGLCTTIFSNPAILTVNPLPTVSISLSNPPIVNPVHSVTITATASPSGGTYVWLKNNVIIPGATGNTLGPLGVFDVGFYKVIYTDLNGCVRTSNEVEVRATPSLNLWVYPNPNLGTFHIRFYNVPNEQMTVQVFSSLGQLVFRKAVLTTLPYTDIVINLGEGGRLIVPGVYVVELLNSNGQRVGTKQIIVHTP